MMNLKTMLYAVAKIIADEAEKNQELKSRLEDALGLGKLKTGTFKQQRGQGGRRAGRRNLAVFDPVERARQGERELRQSLENLDVEQLRDIVAQYGMDPGKLVMKWKDRARIIERIVDISLSRATKGDAFLRN